MAYEIALIRGTTSSQQIRLILDGQPYFLDEKEYIHFGVKEDYHSTRLLIDKIFTKEEQDEEGYINFTIMPSDTQNWPCKTYKYDIGLQSGEEYYIVIPESNFVVKPNITSYGVR